MCVRTIPHDWKLLGRFEEAVLVSLVRLGKAATANEIKDDTQNHLHNSVSFGVLYATLDRLEKKNLVFSQEQGPTGKPGGRSKHLFTITDVGKRKLDNMKKYNENVWSGVVIA
jgi:DNA-binding PadR family transcriptional regulator